MFVVVAVLVVSRFRLVVKDDDGVTINDVFGTSVFFLAFNGGGDDDFGGDDDDDDDCNVKRVVDLCAASASSGVDDDNVDDDNVDDDVVDDSVDDDFDDAAAGLKNPVILAHLRTCCRYKSARVCANWSANVSMGRCSSSFNSDFVTRSK